MPVRLIASLCAALLIAAVPRPAAAAAEPDFAALGRRIEAVKQTTGLPSGTAIAVVRDGRIVYEGYFGLSDIAAKTPVTRDTPFYIASATKPFFALNVLLQAQAGKMNLQTSLQQMFPQTRFPNIDATSVTSTDLLVHASGIDNAPLVWATAYSGIHDTRSRLALVADSHPDAKVKRGTFEYTNVGYNIASVWLDRQVGAPWQQQLDDAIFAPLAMTHTSASIRTAHTRGWSLAKPYSFASEIPREPLYLVKSDATMHAAGGLVSTAPDLARFLIAQLSSGQLDGQQVIDAATLAQSQASQITLNEKYMDFPRTGYAWGWYTGEYKRRRLLHHFGGFAGFHAHLSFMPDENIGLVVLSNEDFLGAQLANLIADHVYGVLLDEPDTEATLSRRFAELDTKAAQFRDTAAKRREEIRSRAWHLTLPRERYAGAYSHPQLGTMTVEVERDGAMVLRWGRVAAIATGYEKPDHVRVEFSPNSGEVLSFVVKDGAVKAISFNGMAFEKMR
jgi:CubicO group peptidase (beta-lactamase class C family)